MKKQTTVKKRKKKTTPVNNTGKLTEKEADALVQTWFSCPPSDLTNMFYVYLKDNGRHETQRAVTYRLEPGALADIISVYELSGRKGALRVHLGCNPAFDPASITEADPAFTPFVQLKIDGQQTYANSYASVWRRRSTSPLDYNVYPGNPSLVDSTLPEDVSRISPYTAHLFLKEWCLTSDADIEGMFSGIANGRVDRVNSFTFEEEDLKEIADIYQKDPTKELFVHLSVIKPNTRSPFGFHIVLEIANVTSNESYAVEDTSTFYEFSYPCPPLCGK